MRIAYSDYHYVHLFNTNCIINYKMEIRLFKTTVKSKAIVSKLAPELNAILKGKKWNFDLSGKLAATSGQMDLQRLVSLLCNWVVN